MICIFITELTRLSGKQFSSRVTRSCAAFSPTMYLCPESSLEQLQGDFLLLASVDDLVCVITEHSDQYRVMLTRWRNLEENVGDASADL